MLYINFRKFRHIDFYVLAYVCMEDKSNQITFMKRTYRPEENGLSENHQ